MLEADMFPYVKLWLERQGYEVYGEVHIKHHDIDVVGNCDYKPMNQIAIEMKKSFTQLLRRQLSQCKAATYWVYSCTQTMPSKANQKWCKEKGIGILVLKDKLRIVSHPTKIPRWKGHKPHWINLCNAVKDQIGGVPSGKDKAPARDVYHNIVEYMTKNPDASWNEVYKMIPNHYAHARSMMQSMQKYCLFNNHSPLTCKGSGSGKGSRKRRKRRFTRFK